MEHHFPQPGNLSLWNELKLFINHECSIQLQYTNSSGCLREAAIIHKAGDITPYKQDKSG